MAGFCYNNPVLHKQAFLTGSLVARLGSFEMFKETIGCDLKYKHIYLCHVDKYIGAYNPHTGEVVDYKSGDMFVPFVQELLEKYPDYTPHNVINEGIQEVIRRKILLDIAKKELQKSR